MIPHLSWGACTVCEVSGLLAVLLNSKLRHGDVPVIEWGSADLHKAGASVHRPPDGHWWDIGRFTIPACCRDLQPASCAPTLVCVCKDTRPFACDQRPCMLVQGHESRRVNVASASFLRMQGHAASCVCHTSCWGCTNMELAVCVCPTAVT